MDAAFLALLAETRERRAALQATVAELTRTIGNPLPISAKTCKPSSTAAKHSDDFPLLIMAEGLVAAHRAAVIDGDGYSLDLIEDALRHVGARLSKECADGRSFERKRLGPR